MSGPVVSIECSGGVVVNPQGEVLVVSQNGDSWALPKGHIDPGEDALTAAKREIKEEAGVTTLNVLTELGSYERFKIGPGGMGEDTSERKHYTFFLFTTTQMELAPEDPHNPEARWVPREQVAALLTHPKDAAFFTSIEPKITDQSEGVN
ncbi:NUDIX domain-containing protein [Candidatus Pacebacteria bacterium]|nr:NUDIX domain-containing protein [Candidatus Paceibacterota bacterium]